MADHNDIWLKEAFAQFFGAYLMKHENYTRINGFQEYMEKEDMMESHEDGVSTNPLQLSATTIGGVRGAYQNRGYFDLYIRGESFVGLLKHLVGGDAQLKQCMTEYLTKFAGKSVEPFDLWTVLSPAGERAGLNFEMDKGLKTWLTEKTQPEIHIKRRSMDVPNRTQVRCKQSPARNSHNAWIAPKPDNKDNGEVLWHIPLTFGTIDNKFRFWFSTKMQKLTIEENLDDRWLLANADRQFPYRVDYDKDNWQLLIKQLKRDPELFSIQTRSMLIMDANYFMYNTRRLPLLIQLLGYLELEKHPLPWHYGISVIGELIPRLRHTADYKIVREYFSKIASTLASRMRDVEFRAFLENTFLSNMFFEKSCNFLCYTGHAACTGAFIGTGLTKRFSTYLNGRGQHSQSFNNSVCYRAFYCHYLLEHATKEDANLLIDFIQNHTHSDYDYGEIMPLILCYRNDSSILQAVVKKYLELVGTSNSIKIDRIVQLAAGSPTSYVFNRQVYYIWRNLKSIIAANGEGYHQTISAMNKASHRFIFAKDSAKYNFVDSINRPQLLRMVRQMVGPRFRQFRVELLEEMTWLSDLHIDSKLNILVG